MDDTNTCEICKQEISDEELKWFCLDRGGYEEGMSCICVNCMSKLRRLNSK